MVGALGTLVMLMGSNAGAITYSFTRIADSATELSPGTLLDASGLGKAAVSGGNVAFRACYGGAAGCGIFTGSGGALTTVVQDGTAAPIGTFASVPPPAGPETFAGPPAFSGSTVVFRAGYQYNSGTETFSNYGIFTGSGSAVTPVVKTGDAAPTGTFSSLLDPSSSGATIAFQGSYSTSAQGVFSTTGGPPLPIATSDTAVPVFGTLSNFKAPSISGSTVAFTADYSGGQGVFTGSGGPLTVVAKSGDPAPSGTFDVGGFFEPVISGSTAAFRARYNDGETTGIFRSSGAALTTIAKLGDPAPVGTINGLSDPSISGNIVAFVGNYGADHALFVSNGGAITPIIKKGDVLFGNSVKTITLDKNGFDADGSGKLAFSYVLTDDTVGVALAMPGGLPLGDYDRNNVIDIADYVLWRDTQGQFVPAGSGADGNYNGVIDVVDYLNWRRRFGQVGETGFGSGDSAGIVPAYVPEPLAAFMLLCGAAGLALLRFRTR